MAKIVLKPMRVTFPKLVVPDAFSEQDRPKYSIRALLPKADKAEQKKIVDAMKEAVASATNLTAEEKKKALKTCLQDKDNDYFVFKDGDAKDYAGHEGHFYINLKRAGDDKEGNKLQGPPCYYPKQAGEKVKPIPTQMIETEIYSGCWCMVAVNISVINKPKPGVFLKLAEIMKFKDDERFVSTAFNSDEFDCPVTDDDNDGDF